MPRRRILAIVGSVAVALTLTLVTVAFAFPPQNFVTPMSGNEENPARDTLARGSAIFQVRGDTVEYRLIASNIENVIMAHIHVGAAGTNGPIVVWLFPDTAPPAADPGGGRHDGVLATGSFTAANLTGPLAGHPLSDLIDLLQNGGAYVNVHTNDGVDPPNTGPGDFPGGEIRGQID
ncbi:MAG TPA: CHRD domain-containing protein [Candidatus Limnocylindria bacterium]